MHEALAVTESISLVVKHNFPQLVEYGFQMDGGMIVSQAMKCCTLTPMHEAVTIRLLETDTSLVCYMHTVSHQALDKQ